MTWEELMHEFEQLGMSLEQCGRLTARVQEEFPKAFETEKCPRCRKQVPLGQVYERYSYGIYAGKFCDSCCGGYRDNCGGGDPNDLDEPIEPEEYYGGEHDGW